MALALHIENEDSTVLDPIISLADVSVPQADFEFLTFNSEVLNMVSIRF